MECRQEAHQVGVRVPGIIKVETQIIQSATWCSQSLPDIFWLWLDSEARVLAHDDELVAIEHHIIEAVECCEGLWSLKWEYVLSDGNSIPNHKQQCRATVGHYLFGACQVTCHQETRRELDHIHGSQDDLQTSEWLGWHLFRCSFVAGLLSCLVIISVLVRCLITWSGLICGDIC